MHISLPFWHDRTFPGKQKWAKSLFVWGNRSEFHFHSLFRFFSLQMMMLKYKKNSTDSLTTSICYCFNHFWKLKQSWKLATNENHKFQFNRSNRDYWFPTKIIFLEKQSFISPARDCFAIYEDYKYYTEVDVYLLPNMNTLFCYCQYHWMHSSVH